MKERYPRQKTITHRLHGTQQIHSLLFFATFTSVKQTRIFPTACMLTSTDCVPSPQDTTDPCAVAIFRSQKPGLVIKMADAKAHCLLYGSLKHSQERPTSHECA